jgi:ABC-type Fe3+/spermidine/putrescine transport system ATPase subunit
MLEVKGLHKRYGGLVAVQEVSFTARPGEAVGLLGPNGAGKTTTVSMIAGLLASDSGELRIEGGVVRGETDPIKRKMGLVPQDLALHDGLSARDNLALFGALYGMRGTELRRAPAGDVGWQLGACVSVPAMAAERKFRGAHALGGRRSGRNHLARGVLLRRSRPDCRDAGFRGFVRRHRDLAVQVGCSGVSLGFRTSRDRRQLVTARQRRSFSIGGLAASSQVAVVSFRKRFATRMRMHPVSGGRC